MNSASHKQGGGDLSLATFVDVENGRRPSSRRANAQLIADALGRPLDSLVKKEAETSPAPHQKVTVVYGVPGIGKTTLVHALANEPEVFAAYPTCLYGSLGKFGPPRSVLGMWGNLTDLPGLAELPLQEARGRLRAHLEDKRVLFILDDVWDIAQAEALTISGPHSATLITTRIAAVARGVVGTIGDAYRLGTLPIEEATELVLQVLERRISTDDAGALARAVEVHTLGLQVISRLVIKYDFSTASLIKEIDKNLSLLLAEHAPRSEDETPLSVDAVLKLSTDFLDEVSRRCFAYLGPMPEKPADFQLSDLEVLWKRLGVDARKMLHTLEESCLLEARLGKGGVFWMHALLVAHGLAVLDQYGPDFVLQCRLDHARRWRAVASGRN